MQLRRRAQQYACFVQWEEDQARAPEDRQWLHFEVDQEGKEPLILLATRSMLQTAIDRGHEGPVYGDTTHGMQRYGLKLFTLHVKDVEGHGV